MDGRRRRAGSGSARQGTPRDPGEAPSPGEPTVYQIRVRGHLDDRWADAFAGLSIRREEGGDTVLTVPVVDQAALHGLLRKLRDFAVPLVSINPAGPGQPGDASMEDSR